MNRAVGRFEPGPVFWCEWRRAARDRWSYAIRSILVGGLLAALSAVCWATVYRMELFQARAIEDARVWCFVIIVMTQLSMVLLVAPVATAGAFSTEMARGHVLLTLVTGITPAEIIFGTLAARVLAVLWSVACVVPVLFLAAELTGIPTSLLVRLEVISAGTALVGCTLALSLSIGARRLHETLLSTYVILLGWVLGPPILFMIGITSVGRFLPGWLGRSMLFINPYWLIVGPIVRPGFYRWDEPWKFLAGATALSLLLAFVGVWRLGPAAESAGAGVGSGRWLKGILGHLSFVRLDSYPVFWRECRMQQTSRWIGVLWRLYVAGAIFFTVLAVSECATKGPNRTFWAGPFNGFQAAVGLLLLSVTTPAALAEDRARGSLELLLSTPISTRSLVLSKWCAYYRPVPCLAMLPAVIAAAHANVSGRWSGVLLVAAMVLVQGAAVTSLGIALATWSSRVDRALILSAAAAVVVTVAWVPLAVRALRRHQLEDGGGLGQPAAGCRATYDGDGTRIAGGVARARRLGPFLGIHLQRDRAGPLVGDAGLV